MPVIKQFEDLEVWQKARELTRLVYRISSEGHFTKDFGLRDQIRRASVSIMSNISEGFERSGDKEFKQFLSIAKGSCGELRAQLYIAFDQLYITKEIFEFASNKSLEVSRMIHGLMKYLQKSDNKGKKYR